jgi:hypothetical protein
MTQVFQQLHHRSRALAQGLLVVLLATWMSTVCQHCLAQAVDAPTQATHCQHDAPPPGDGATDGHDCCPQAAAPICDSGDCAQLSNVISNETLTVIASETPAQAMLPGTLFSQVYSTIPPPPRAIAYTTIADPCPLYLRHCVFRN